MRAGLCPRACLRVGHSMLLLSLYIYVESLSNENGREKGGPGGPSLGFGRIVASETEVPNIIVNLV